MLKFVDFLLKSAFFRVFSQKPYICSVFYVFPSDCEKIVKKKSLSLNSISLIFHTIIGYYTRLPLDFNLYRKKPLQSPLQSHADSNVGNTWEEFGKIKRLAFELISGALGSWEIFI